MDYSVTNETVYRFQRTVVRHQIHDGSMAFAHRLMIDGQLSPWVHYEGFAEYEFQGRLFFACMDMWRNHFPEVFEIGAADVEPERSVP